MNRLYCLVLVLFTVSAQAQPSNAPPSYHIRYDHSALRIPGKKFAIGLVVPAQGRNAADTIGYPGKKGSWSKYRLSVDSGSFSGGTVKLKNAEVYKRRDSVYINVYSRKWFLGGKGKWLASRKIPYNYEDSLVLLSNGNTDKSPGDHLKFGVRTIYDDKQFADQWFPAKKKNSRRFLLGFDGAHLSRSKGDLKIDEDPGRITNDRIRLFARLAKDSAIGDTLSLLLDYTAQYKCQIRSGGAGDPLGVTADLFDDSIIHAPLLRVEVYDSAAKRSYHYLVNTSGGGGLTISSKGGDGMGGRSGSDGSAGLNGSDGLVSVDVETTTAADGSMQTTSTTTQGRGGDGGNGGNGEDGGRGDDGFDGGNIVVRYQSVAAPFIGRLKVVSIPGVGGSGGRGGTGGSGGSGGNGTPSGNAGLRGLDGSNGFNGSSGKAGIVRFVLKG
jgi:hypothetical protein